MAAVVVYGCGKMLLEIAAVISYLELAAVINCSCGRILLKLAAVVVYGCGEMLLEIDAVKN